MKYRFMESKLKINGEYYTELNCLELLELFRIVRIVYNSLPIFGNCCYWKFLMPNINFKILLKEKCKI